MSPTRAPAHLLRSDAIPPTLSPSRALVHPSPAGQPASPRDWLADSMLVAQFTHRDPRDMTVSTFLGILNRIPLVRDLRAGVIPSPAQRGASRHQPS